MIREENMSSLSSLAVKAALATDWDSAIKFNKRLLRENGKDIETLNRLAYALLEKGDLQTARKLYLKVLRLDRANPIAEKNLRKIAGLADRKKKKVKPSKPKEGNGASREDISSIFLEEPGRTKITRLRNLSEPHILSSLRPADEVVLSIKRHSIFAKTPEGVYIGALPDDVSHKLIPFMKGGNEYKAFIKAVEKNSVAILIKEIKRGRRFKNSPSFSAGSSSYYAFVREDAIKDQRRPDVTTYEDLEDEEESSDEE